MKVENYKARRLKAILWDALGFERSIEMNCEVSEKSND